MPEYGPGDLYAFLRTAASSPLLPAQELLDGLLNRLVAREVLKSAVRRLPAYAREYKPAELSAIAARVRDFRFPVTGTAGWQAGAGDSGRRPLSEVDISTLESRLCSGVYLTGELLNLDGDCARLQSALGVGDRTARRTQRRYGGQPQNPLGFSFITQKEHRA